MKKLEYNSKWVFLFDVWNRLDYFYEKHIAIYNALLDVKKLHDEKYDEYVTDIMNNTRECSRHREMESLLNDRIKVLTAENVKMKRELDKLGYRSFLPDGKYCKLYKASTDSLIEFIDKNEVYITVSDIGCIERGDGDYTVVHLKHLDYQAGDIYYSPLPYDEFVKELRGSTE